MRTSIWGQHNETVLERLGSMELVVINQKAGGRAMAGLLRRVQA